MSNKKNFKNNNPASYFITSSKINLQKDNTDNTDNTHEIKSKRINLLLYPSLFENLKKIAIMKQRSVNNLINDLLSKYINQELNTISDYDKTFKN